jgi:hypothetical protein
MEEGVSEFSEYEWRRRAVERLHRNPWVAVLDRVWPGDVPKYGIWLKDFAVGPDGQSSFVGELFACDKWMNECKHVKSGKTWSQLHWEHLEKVRINRFWRRNA